MSEIVRFSVSLEDDLLEQFDRYCSQQQFATRSEAIRQLLRDALTKEAWASESQDAAGTLTLVYDHHRPQLREHLMKLQHDHNDLVVSTLHAHLTHDLCLEVIVLRGAVRPTSKDRRPVAGAQRDLQRRTGDGQRGTPALTFSPRSSPCNVGYLELPPSFSLHWGRRFVAMATGAEGRRCRSIGRMPCRSVGGWARCWRRPGWHSTTCSGSPAGSC